MTTDKVDMTISERICAWVSGLRYEDIPAPVVDKLKLIVLDALGLAIAASHHVEAGGIRAVGHDDEHRVAVRGGLGSMLPVQRREGSRKRRFNDAAVLVPGRL